MSLGRLEVRVEAADRNRGLWACLVVSGDATAPNEEYERSQQAQEQGDYRSAGHAASL